MGKRGQFYLIAAFIIILIMSGLSYTYSSVNLNKGNINLADLGEEVSYETDQLINNQILEGKPAAEISNRINEILAYYEERYFDITIIIVYGDKDQSFVIDSKNIRPVDPVEGKVKVNIKDIEQEVDMNVKSSYVILFKESEGERGFVVK